MTDDGYGRAITTIRAGLSLGAAAAILMAISPFFDVVTGPAAEPPGAEFTAGVGTSVGVGAAVGAIVIIAAVAQRVLWQHLLGIVVTTGVALLSALLVISARMADEYADDADVTLQAGGRFQLTPRYDVLSALPVLGTGAGQLSPHKVKMAMALHGEEGRHELKKDAPGRRWLGS